jgi:integrase
MLDWTFQPYLDKENDAAKKLPPRIGLTLAGLVEEWRTNVAVNLKGSTTRAAEPHLRAHIIPKMGNYHLPEITTKIVQGFVAYFAGGRRSRKTAETVLLTLSSLLKTARAWGYACGDFRFADLTLPREGITAEPRSFTDEEVRKIITYASEPLSIIVAVTAVLGLRIGETLALSRSDVDCIRPMQELNEAANYT